MTNERLRVTVAGAGFAGLWAVRGLADAPVKVLLVDRNNYHTFLPLLYQVAAAELEPEAIAYPIRTILRGIPNARFLLAEVEGVDLAARQLQTSVGPVSYDYLVLTLGSAPHFFSVPGVREHAFTLKSMEDAIRLRNHILGRFEVALWERDPDARKKALTFVVVGGGPTGVEFAGALAELINGPLRRDYPDLNLREVRVVLLEAQAALLPGLPERLQRYACRRLEEMGIDVRLEAAVEHIESGVIHVRRGQTIASETVIWTAGVQGIPQVARWGLPTGRGGRVAVLPTLQVAGHPEVYVAGDLAYVEQAGWPLPMTAPVATQQGKAVAANIRRQLQGQAALPFRYRDRGVMATIGRNVAVAHVFGRSFTGFIAWVLWLGVHLFNLIGFRNRLLVMLSWAWDYFFYERVVRLLLPRLDRDKR